MRALETIRRDIDARVPSLKASKRAIRESGFDSSEEIAVLRGLIDKLGNFEKLASEIETAIDEDALMARTREEERRAMTEEVYGERQRERQEEEETAERAEGDGLWGEDQPWVIRESSVSSLVIQHRFFSR